MVPAGLLGREPVLWLAMIQAALALAMGFGWHVTPEQMALIMTFAGAVIAFLARTQVTPAHDPVVPTPPPAAGNKP